MAQQKERVRGVQAQSRGNQIYGKNVIIVECISVFYFICRCGFAGETGPRCIIPSVIKKSGMPKVFFF